MRYAHGSSEIRLFSRVSNWVSELAFRELIVISDTVFQVPRPAYQASKHVYFNVLQCTGIVSFKSGRDRHALAHCRCGVRRVRPSAT
jgi:poly-beta-hydroxyalkanoate depolymerase